MKLTFIYSSGRKIRLIDNTTGPTEFFYGFHELKDLGFSVQILEEDDICSVPPFSGFIRYLGSFFHVFFRLPLGMFISLIHRCNFSLLNKSDVLISTTNSMGLSLAIARSLKIVRTPVFMIAMGVLPLNPSFLSKWTIGLFLRKNHLITISRAEQAFLQAALPNQPVHYIPFGVDTNFWKPCTPTIKRNAFVLAIGNDSNRDWETLLAAWNPDMPLLKIVTRLPLPSTAPNIEKISGDWRTRIHDDSEILHLYQSATFVIVPVKNTIQPSGQSVCLQAMACACPVIISDFAGLWDRDLLVHDENVLLVTPESSIDLNLACRRLLSDLDLRNRLSIKGYKLVHNHFTMIHMASNLVGHLSKISSL